METCIFVKKKKNVKKIPRAWCVHMSQTLHSVYWRWLREVKPVLSVYGGFCVYKYPHFICKFMFHCIAIWKNFVFFGSHYTHCVYFLLFDFSFFFGTSYIKWGLIAYQTIFCFMNQTFHRHLWSKVWVGFTQVFWMDKGKIEQEAFRFTTESFAVFKVFCNP